jgi:nitroreductase
MTEAFMEFSEVVAKRRSTRHFSTRRAVTHEDLRSLLESAVTAPTAGNIQPWRFVVLESEEARARLTAAIGQKWATAAPAIIVVCVDPRPCAARYGERGERLYAIQDTSAAVQTILLAAVDLGLASCWIGAFDDEAVREAIGMPRPITPVAVLPIGYSAEAAGKPSRRPLEEVTTWL